MYQPEADLGRYIDILGPRGQEMIYEYRYAERFIHNSSTATEHWRDAAGKMRQPRAEILLQDLAVKV